MLVIEFLRRQKGWSQKILGDQPDVRIDQSFISLIERGYGLPSDDQRCRLAKVLGCKPERLLDPIELQETVRG